MVYNIIIDDNHNEHHCIDELVRMVKKGLDELVRYWKEERLSCNKVNEELKEYKIDLFEISEGLELFNIYLYRDKLEGRNSN